MKTLKFTSMLIGCFFVMAASANAFNGKVEKNNDRYTVTLMAVLDGKQYEVSSIDVQSDWVSLDAEGKVTHMDEASILKAMNQGSELFVHGQKAEGAYFTVEVSKKIGMVTDGIFDAENSVKNISGVVNLDQQFNPTPYQIAIGICFTGVPQYGFSSYGTCVERTTKICTVFEITGSRIYTIPCKTKTN